MKRILYLVLLLLAVPSMGYSQNIDSLLRNLPSQEEYYTPQALPHSWVLAGDSSSQELVAYLRDNSVTLPKRSIPYLSTSLSLPWVLRPMGAVHPLSISVPSLSEASKPVDYAEQLLRPYRIEKALIDGLWYALQSRHADLFTYTSQSLQLVKEQKVLSKGTADVPALLLSKMPQKSIKDYADQLTMEEIQRKYWIPGFESSVQFSQNYISDNWNKGGASNLNLQMRNYLSLLYQRERVRWLNELESKLGLYRTGEETNGDRYRINEDLLRLHSNYGIKFNKRWSYTLDGELRTQLFDIHSGDNKVLQSAPFAPLRTNLGLGLLYTYSKKSKQVYGRSFSVNFNIAPLSHNWRWSHRDDIDLARHGLTKDKLSVHTFGSTMRGVMQWNINMDVSWTSRVYFNTSYKNVEAEWENTLVMRISRYFSTRVNVQLRFDDNEAPSSQWNKHLQINELLSVGFNYKL